MKSALSSWRDRPRVTTSLRRPSRYCAGNRCGSRGTRAKCNSGTANCSTAVLRQWGNRPDTSHAGSAAREDYTTGCLKTVLKVGSAEFQTSIPHVDQRNISRLCEDEAKCIERHGAVPFTQSGHLPQWDRCAARRHRAWCRCARDGAARQARQARQAAGQAGCQGRQGVRSLPLQPR